MIFSTLLFDVESIFWELTIIGIGKTAKVTFLTKNLKNCFYNHHHLTLFECPLAPHYTLKIRKIKFPTPIFHLESIFDGFRTIRIRKNHFLTKNHKKWSLQLLPLGLSWSPLDPHYTLKTRKTKFPTLIFHVESIFDGFRTIGTRKNG